MWSDRTRGNDFILKEGRLRFEIRKKFIPEKVVRHWHVSLKKAVSGPCLEMFKNRLDEALNNLV